MRYVRTHSISFEQLQDPWAAAQIDQVDARCDNAAADQHADHANPMLGLGVIGVLVGCSVITAGINLIYLGCSPWIL